MAGHLHSNAMTIDVEEWFHILDCPTAPAMRHWTNLESRLESMVKRILELLARYETKATFFWLGWVARRHRCLVQQCVKDGHEIASHGYAHVLPYKVGKKRFRTDIVYAKSLLEDITGEKVKGFRAPGFGILSTTSWAFDIIKETGHLYDASIFPAHRGHGGIVDGRIGPHLIETKCGHLFEIPASVAGLLGRRISLFGGGYLRLAPMAAIKWGVARVEAEGRPLIVYFHPRDIDPGQPRLALPRLRRFKSYVNLHTTLQKVRWLCGTYRFGTMCELMKAYVAHAREGIVSGVTLPGGIDWRSFADSTV